MYISTESQCSAKICENNASKNWGFRVMVKNELVEGTKGWNDCGFSDWVRPIGAGWLGVAGTKMERATGSGEASDSESDSGSKEAWVSKSFTNWKSQEKLWLE